MSTHRRVKCLECGRHQEAGIITQTEEVPRCPASLSGPQRSQSAAVRDRGSLQRSKQMGREVIQSDTQGFNLSQSVRSHHFSFSPCGNNAKLSLTKENNVRIRKKRGKKHLSAAFKEQTDQQTQSRAKLGCSSPFVWASLHLHPICVFQRPNYLQCAMPKSSFFIRPLSPARLCHVY